MDPTTTGKFPQPTGYITYANDMGQFINPLTGNTVGPSDPYWHIPIR